MKTILFKSRSWWKAEWDIIRDDQRVGEFVITKQFSYGAARIQAESNEWIFEAEEWSWSGGKHLIKTPQGEKIGSSTWVSWLRSDISIEISGKRYTMKPSNWWWSKYAIYDTAGKMIIECRPNIWNSSAAVEILDYSVDTATLYLLASILFYRVKLIEMQSASGASGAGAVVVMSGS